MLSDRFAIPTWGCALTLLLALGSGCGEQQDAPPPEPSPSKIEQVDVPDAKRAAQEAAERAKRLSSTPAKRGKGEPELKDADLVVVFLNNIDGDIEPCG